MDYLIQLMHFGYTIILGVFFLMIWISFIESREIESVRDPPCNFNTLCSCSKSSADLGIVQCRDVHLPRIPQDVNISKVFKLHLENNQFRDLPPYFLQSTGLYNIVIRNNPLYSIPPEAFLGLERSLGKLELSHCRLTEVPSNALIYLQKLMLLDLTGNHITDIKAINWRGLEKSLETLNLAENSISQIPLDTFSGLPNLETIDLRGNHLREIDPLIFRDGMGKLANLLLGDNQLSSIPYQALQPLKTLKMLDLSYNLINKMTPTLEPGGNINPNYQLNLDTFRLDYNQITILHTSAFQYFNFINKTYLDGNPLTGLENSAFRTAKIRELYLRSCGLTSIEPAAFDGLENYLELLDLSGNNISLLPQDIFARFLFVKSLLISDNIIINWNSMNSLNSLQLTLTKLDLSGTKNYLVNLQDLRRFRYLRTLKLSRLSQPNVQGEDFRDFGIDLQEFSVNYANLQSVKNNAFKYVHSLKFIDLSDNNIGTIESNAFNEVSYTLEHLCLAHAFSASFKEVPSDFLKVLRNLEHLDFSNNKFRSLGETTFHFLNNLQKLHLEDNVIEVIHKGTFQADIHTDLEEIYLSFNNLKTISQYTFVHLPKLEQLHLDDNKIEILESKSFKDLESLKRLNLKGNKLDKLPYETFQNLPELEHLDMAYNKITNFDFSIFDQVGTLANFCLNLSHNSLKELTVNLTSSFQGSGGGYYHSNIKVLDLSFNNISSISSHFFKPAEISLTNLYLSNNQLMNATKAAFGNMPHLQLLDLSKNRIYEINFDMFGNTKNLQILDVSYNRITEIHQEIFRNMNKLRIVDLSHNRLRNLPDNLFVYSGLEKLDISHNLLSKTPLGALSIITEHNLLTELDLSWNSISSLPLGVMFERFKRLNVLDLSYNRLAQIDVGVFKELSRLVYLDLSHNSQLSLELHGGSFQGIEDSLLHLRLDNVSLSSFPTLPTYRLITLSIADNSLPNLPAEMARNMTQLQNLNLNYNSLTMIPFVTFELPKLRVLSMVENEISYLGNTSLLGLAKSLEVLDIRNLDLTTLEAGTFCKLYSLETLKMNLYTGFKIFNFPNIIQYNIGLRNLEIHVDKPSESDLSKEMFGDFPLKLRNITLSGQGLKKLAPTILKGVLYPELHFCISNTSITQISAELFKNSGKAKNLTIDVRNNRNLKGLMNPSTGSYPGLFRKTFLKDLKSTGNKWDCDCDLGWIEVWQRKYRQYICQESPSIAPTFSNFDYKCRHTDDELRLSVCGNKNNNSIIDVLKTDIECGWSSASILQLFNSIFYISLVSLLIMYF